MSEHRLHKHITAVTALAVLLLCCSCCGAVPQTPALPLLTGFEEYIDTLKTLPVPAKEQVQASFEEPAVLLIYPNDDTVLSFIHNQELGKLLQGTYSFSKGTGLRSYMNCPLGGRIGLVGDGQFVAVPLADGLRLCWMDQTDSVMKCDIKGTQVQPDPSAANPHDKVPAGVRMLDPLGDENTFGWKGRFNWLDADGGVLVDASLPPKLGAASRSPLAFRYGDKASLWALRSWSLETDQAPGDIPPTDLSILSVTKSTCRVLETIDRKTIPLKAEKDWSVSSVLDSPAWIVGSREVLVYRHVWSVHVGSPPHNEALYVSELWMKPMDGKARLLDMTADYAGTVGNLYWRIDQNGDLIESAAGQEHFAIETDLDLQPFPALFGPKIAYLRNGRIVKMEVPK